jgi:glycosyltransferase involved in cell wall biosynthesis
VDTLYHQLQGLYTAGDVMCAVDCVRALPEYRHVFFVSHDDGFNADLADMLAGLGATIRRQAIVTEADLLPNLRAVFYHCVGYDDHRRGEYVRFRAEPPGVRLCAWIHTPGLCGHPVERYPYLNHSGCSHLIFNSSFTLQNTPGLDRQRFARTMIINPAVDSEHYACVKRVQDGVFRIGRWSRGHDSKYSDDFLDLLGSLDIAGMEAVCMGVPGKFRDRTLPPGVRFLENEAMPIEALQAELDVLLFKTDGSSWHEGWCRTVTEAMAAGLVPVVENRGGLIDQVTHGYNGFLCADNAEFKHYVQLLHQSPALRARLSANARDTACRNYTLGSLRRDLLDLIAPTPPRRLNFGCGFDIRPGFVNFDNRPLPGVDVAATVDPFYPHLPFGNDEFDEILAFHVLEHVADRAAILGEVWRIARHNAVIRIKVPDRNHSDAFLDPTHLSFWEVDTIDFFLPGHLRGYYSPARFALLSKYTTGREIGWELLAIKRHPTAHLSTQDPRPALGGV